jgi:hypothetical protein
MPQDLSREDSGSTIQWQTKNTNAGEFQMTASSEAGMEGHEVDSERRHLMKVATTAGLAGALAMSAGAAEPQRAGASAVEDPKAPPGMGRTGIPDLRFPLCYETPVIEGTRVLMKHFAALARRDMKGVADTLHFPYGSYEGVELVVVQTPEQLLAQPPASLNMSENPARFTSNDGYMKRGCYDVFGNLEVLTSDPVNATLSLCYDRYGSDGKKLLRCEGMYAVTNNNGRWAIQLASTIFTPADMIGVVYEDTIQVAKRLRVLHTLASNVGDVEIAKLAPQYGRAASIEGGASWTVQTEGSDKVMAEYRIKGVNSRLRIREIDAATPNSNGSRDHPNDWGFYRDTMAKIGLGPWGWAIGTWREGRVMHHTVDKAHAMASAVRYTAAGEEMSLATQAVVVTFRKNRWGLAGQLAYSTIHDRANDIHPGGLSFV